MIVVFNPKVPHILTVPLKGNPKRPVITGSVVLRPGTNQVNDASFEIMYPILKNKIATGEIKTIGEVEETPSQKKNEPSKIEIKESKTIAEMEPKEAVKLVEECVNMDTLKEWKDIPKLSDEVRFAVTKQIDEITVKDGTKDNTKKG